MGICLTFLLAVFRIILIPTQFQDCTLTASDAQIASLLADASTYFNDQYRGTQTFSFEQAPPVTLPKAHTYYGKNSVGIHDAAIYEAVEQACRLSSGNIDFSSYDNDGDGELECVILLTAGLSEADATGEDNIWPQQDMLSAHSGKLTISGKKIDRYIITPELWSAAGSMKRFTGIGDLCHEFGHILGLPDYYDADGEASGGRSSAMYGSTALMDEGNLNDDGRTPPHFNALDLELLGLGKSEPLNTGTYILEPVNRNGRYLKAETGRDGEYFLFEVRENKGRDAFIGGNGLLVYHIDRSSPVYIDRWTYNQVNCYPDHQCAYVLAAKPGATLASDAFFPRADARNFTAATAPSFSFWNGNTSSLALTEIARQADGSVSFRVIQPFTIKETLQFQDAILLSWETDPSLSGRTVSVSWSNGEKLLGNAGTVTGTSYLIEGLLPETTYSIELRTDNASGIPFSLKTEVTTRAVHAGTMPYIFLGSAKRNEDGSFVKGTGIPLRVFNESNVTEIHWLLDGKDIKTGADGYYHLEKSGELRAIINHSDSGPSILFKQITVR